MGSKQIGQTNQRNRSQENAARLAYLRNTRFETVGFGYHETPTLSEARKAAGENLRRMANTRPTPSVAS